MRHSANPYRFRTDIERENRVALWYEWFVFVCAMATLYLFWYVMMSI